MSLDEALRDALREVIREELSQLPAAGEPARMLTLEETAERLSVSPTTVRRLIRDGRLAVWRDGRLVRVPSLAVAAFVESHTRIAIRVRQAGLSDEGLKLALRRAAADPAFGESYKPSGPWPGRKRATQ